MSWYFMILLPAVMGVLSIKAGLTRSPVELTSFCVAGGIRTVGDAKAI